MKKRKILALLLCAAMLLTLLAACGSSSSSSDTTETEEEEEEEVEEEESAEEETEEEEAEEEAAEEEAAEEATEEAAEEEVAEEEEAAEEEAADGEMTAEEQIEAVQALVVENPYSFPLTEDDVTFTLWSDLIPPLFNYMPNGMADNLVYTAMEELTGVHMEVTSVAMDNASTQVSLIVTSGDYPDIWYGFTSYYTNSIDEAIEEELIINLADYKDYFPTFFSIVDQFDIYSKNAYTDEGNVSVLNGLWTSPSIDSGLTIRGDWLDELGLDVPTTLDEFHDVLTIFHDTYGATYFMTEVSSDPANSFAQCFGVNGYAQDTSGYAYYIAEDGETVVFTPLLDGFYDYLDTMHQWYEEGLIYSDFVSATDNVPDTSILLNDEIGITYYTVSNYTTLMSSVDEDSSFYLQAVDVPVDYYTGEAVHLGRTVDYCSSKGYSLSTNIEPGSEEFEIVCAWLDYMYTDEGSQLCNYGVEGTTYTIDENGEIEWTDLMLDNPSGLAYSWCLNCYTFGAGSFRIDSTRTMEYYGDDEMSLMDVWNNSSNDAADVLPSAISLTADESYTYSAIFNDIGTHVQTNILSFITGTRSLDEYDDFIAEIEDMGIDECTAILQDALDRYNAR